MKNLILVAIMSLAFNSTVFAEHHKSHPMKSKSESSCHGKDCKKSKACHCKEGTDCSKKKECEKNNH